MKGANKKISNLKINKKIIIIVASIFLLASFITIVTTQIVRQIRIKQLEDKPLLEYVLKEVIDYDEKCKIVVKITNVDGLETVKYISPKTNKEVELKCNGKMTVAIDYEAIENESYEFKIKVKGKAEQTESFIFKIPRIEGNYVLSDGIYVNEPDTSGFVEGNTRYMYADSNGNLVPGNWFTGDKPDNWYNYKERKWANIYSENNGVDSFYVWIPRYVYKVDENNSAA